MYLGRQPILYLFIFKVNLLFFLCMCAGVNIYAHEGGHESAYAEDRGIPQGSILTFEFTLRWDSTVLLLSTPDTWLLASSRCLLYPHRSPEITAFVWAIGFQALDLRNAGKYFYPLKHLFIPKSQFSETNHIYIYVSTCVYMHAGIEILNNF